jgi:hypothetical protein
MYDACTLRVCTRSQLALSRMIRLNASNEGSRPGSALGNARSRATLMRSSSSLVCGSCACARESERACGCSSRRRWTLTRATTTSTTPVTASYARTCATHTLCGGDCVRAVAASSRLPRRARAVSRQSRSQAVALWALRLRSTRVRRRSARSGT